MRDGLQALAFPVLFSCFLANQCIAYVCCRSYFAGCSPILPQTAFFEHLEGRLLQVCPSWRTCDAAPAVEPERAKGQWDYMLEEAHWLATDFAQVTALHHGSTRTEGPTCEVFCW